MPANKKVSVGWQVVCTFLPIANFWAFYRIRMLRKYVLYVIVPEVVLTTFYLVYFFSNIDGGFIFDDMTNNNAFADESDYVKTQFDDSDLFDQLSPESWQLYLLVQIANWGLQGFSIYLVVVWSRQHNRQYDQPTVQPSA